MNYRPLLVGFFVSFCIALMCLPKSSFANEVVFTPGIGLSAEYDDNIDFTSNSDEAKDDFSGSAIPEARLEYRTERLNLNSYARLNFKKYLSETDFDRTNQLYEFESEYQARQRWTLFGNYRFRRDETTDSQFDETGRVFKRSRAQRHYAMGGVRFALTELTDIGPFLSYNRADFSGSDNTDYDLYSIELPFNKKFQNQLDTIRLTPAYSHYKSDDNEKGDDYRLTVGWKRLISETLTFDISVGPRYTTLQTVNGDENSNFGGVGAIGLTKKGETFKGSIHYSHDLSPTAEGEIINLDRLLVSADKLMTERLGIRFAAKAFHSNRENNDTPNDKVITFELIPALYYMLTENHFVELAYDYRNERELDKPGNPVTQRNQVWLGLQLRFPKKWD
jgi:hypothetical protein